MASIMKAKDSVSARLATCTIKLSGKRYNFAQAINLEAEVEKTKADVPILGQTGYGHKAAGWSGTGSATFHFNTSIFRKAMETYKNTGEDFYFDIEVTNEDPTSDAGAQTVILEDCNIDNLKLAAFDADGEYLEDSFDFTFENFRVPEEFDDLDVM